MRTKRFVTALAACVLMFGVLVPAAGAAEGTERNTGLEVAESAYGSYIILMRDDPLLRAFDRAELVSTAAEAERTQLRNAHDQVLTEAGAPLDRKLNEFTNAANGFSALLSHADALRVAGSKDVLAVVPDELRQPATENTPSFLGLTERGRAWARGYTGEKVVVGVIDTGIWPEHPSFSDDRSYQDLGIALDESAYPACDFGNSTHNPNDLAFKCNNKLLGARQILPTYRALMGVEQYEYDSARDDNGHGTHAASIAAGNADVDAAVFGIDRGVVSGIAPRARIIAYKSLGNKGGFSSDLAAAIDQAVLDGVDVINYSVSGSEYSSGDEFGSVGVDDLAFLFAAAAGVSVAIAAGNGGPSASGFAGPAWLPWVTAVGASTHDRTHRGSASSGDDWEFVGASITAGTDELGLVDAADAGDELCHIGALNPDMVEGRIVLCLRGSISRLEKSHAVHAAGGAGMILYNASDAQVEVADSHWVPAVHVNSTDGLLIKDYIGAAGDAAVAQISGGKSVQIDAPRMAFFSSRGPNPVAADIIKPDITAPGVDVLAGNTPLSTALSPPGSGAPGQLFQSLSGTSASSAHVAGLMALFKQARRNWTPAMVKSAIMTTAHQSVLSADGVTPAGPFDMGAGHLDPSGRVYSRKSIFSPGIVYDAGLPEYVGFLCDAAPEVFADPKTSCSLVESLGIPTDASDLNLPSIAVAELTETQTVTRTITSVAPRAATWRVSVEAPPGFTAEVSPLEITLGPRESASYTVTFTVTDEADLDAWSFGSLTWRAGRGAAAYSPIAVKAVDAGAPDAAP